MGTEKENGLCELREGKTETGMPAKSLRIERAALAEHERWVGDVVFQKIGSEGTFLGQKNVAVLIGDGERRPGEDTRLTHLCTDDEGDASGFGFFCNRQGS